MELFSKIAFSSENHEWGTPQKLFDELDSEFHFTLDPCATSENAKCPKYYTYHENGLNQDWSKDIVFMNPPYGREIKRWLIKAYLESQRGAIVVCLIPARTDTEWWNDIVIKGEIRFIRGRIKFQGAKYNAPFPSAIIIFPKKYCDGC